MPLTREEYLAACQTCLKSKFDKGKGIVCSITGDHADYKTEHCPEYAAEERAVKRQEAAKRRAIEEADERKGIFSGKAGITGGIVLVVLGLIWIIVGLMFMNRFFFYPIVFIVGGIISINKGVQNKQTEIRRERSEVLDDEII